MTACYRGVIVFGGMYMKALIAVAAAAAVAFPAGRAFATTVYTDS